MRNSMNYEQVLSKQIQRLRDEKNYRFFRRILKLPDEYPVVLDIVSGKKVVMWCSNDYLCMSIRKQNVMAPMGAGGTRNMGGTSDQVVQLEESIADLHKKQAALTFTSGYSANVASLSTLINAFDDIAVFSDELNHSSIIEGIRHSKAEKFIYKHNDILALEQSLKTVDSMRPKLIVFESVYSMDGDIADVKAVSKLAKQYGAITYVDEVHATGLYGRQGGGISELQNASFDIDVIQGTLAKSYGAAGGYIASSTTIIDYIRSFAKGFIFSTALSPAIADFARENIETIKHDPLTRLKLFENVSKVKKALANLNIPVMGSPESHIIPVVIGESELCSNVANALFDEYSIYLQPVNYPTVPKGTERLRITPSPAHNGVMIENLITALANVLRKFEIIK